MNKNKKDQWWGAFINLSGLSDIKPLRVRKEPAFDSWWIDEGPMKDDFEFSQKGLHVQEYCVSFISNNHDEVLAFINGARALSTIIHNHIPRLQT